jgi:hypothetical protein
LAGALLLGGIAVLFWRLKDSGPTTLPIPGEVPGVTALFQDMTGESDVDFAYHNGEDADLCTILESVGGGAALFDFDGDGLLDVFLPGGGYFAGPDKKEILGHPCKLYRNLGQWKFQDVTARVGLDKTWFYSHGCAVGDYDCDGWPDLLVTGYGKLALLHNESDGHGNRRFVDVTRAARLDSWLWGTSAAWADLDGDGYPDLYLCQYVDWSWKTHGDCRGDHRAVARDICPPEKFAGLPHRVFRNNRDGTFTDVSTEAGLQPECGKGLGVVIVDVNDDARPDIYAVNDTVRNFLYVNHSVPGRLRFTETAVGSGVAWGDRAIPDGSMGVDAADYDGSGRPSLLVTTFEGEIPALYHNDGGGDGKDVPLFRYATLPAGLAAYGTRFVGFGAAFIDADLDGWEDLVIVNGHVRRFPTRSGLRQKALLFRNQGDGRFVPISHQGGAYFDALHRGRGLAAGDLDNDGRTDLLISHLNTPVRLLRNIPHGKAMPKATPQSHWLGIDLRGRNNRDVTGARVVVELGSRRLTRFAKGGASYLSAPDRRLLFGLGHANVIDRLSVFWPWGQKEQWSDLPVDRYWQLREGEREPRSLSR